MIAAGMTHIATAFAAVMFAARRFKWSHEIRGTKGVGLGFVQAETGSLPQICLTNVKAPTIRKGEKR